MIILAGKIVSDDYLAHLEKTSQSVVDTPYARERGKNFALNLVSSDEAARRVREGERLYSTNEDALEWVYKNLAGSELVRAIDMMKNKAQLRDLTKEMYPNFFYRDCSLEELNAISPSALKYPLILKLTVGFGSVGVYTLFNEKDFINARTDIANNQKAWREAYDEKVIGSRFLLEEMILSPEYAVDVYYNDKGEAVVLNIFEHRFSSARDVSDRLYCCGESVINEMLGTMQDFFTRVNKKMKLKNFPLHAEVRRYGDSVIPIEFNPLRFAGLSTSDTAFYAYGFYPSDAFLNNEKINFTNVLKRGLIYSFVLVDKGGQNISSKTFDYDALCKNFTKVCSLRIIDQIVPKLFAILITETKAESQQELFDVLSFDFTKLIK